MRLAVALVLTAVVNGPTLAQVPNPKLTNPPARPPVATAPAAPAEIQTEGAPEKTQLELMQERLAEREAQAMRSICSNCGGRR